MSYPKKDWRGLVHQSFFGYDNDKDLKAHFLVTHLTCLRSVNANCRVPSLKPGTGSELAKTETESNRLVQDVNCGFYANTVKQENLRIREFGP